VVIDGWLRDIHNYELAMMFRPEPHSDVLLLCGACDIWRRYSRTLATVGRHAQKSAHMTAVDGTLEGRNSPEQRLASVVATPGCREIGVRGCGGVCDSRPSPLAGLPSAAATPRHGMREFRNGG
jgi:hypothetical protein